MAYPLQNIAQLETPTGVNEHARRVIQELREAGASWYGRLKWESHYLPQVIHHNEHVKAVVYGVNEDGSAMLVATDRRIIYLDKKPMFIKSDEITYDIVGGVSYGSSGIFTTVVLHSRIGDFTMHLVSWKCAQKFIEFIEEQCLNYRPEDRRPQGAV